MSLNRLSGKVGIVTGAGSGIGRAIARLFAQEGSALVLAELDETRGQQTLQEIRENGGTAQLLVGDVSRSRTCEQAIDAALEISGSLDLLVNNAGIIHRGSILDTEPETWDRVMAVNLRSVFLMCRAAVSRMQAGASILNIASGWGLTGGQLAAAYCASKGGVVQLTRAMALDHGRQGIRVNCICPGDTDTRLLRQEAEQLGLDWDSFSRQAAARPLGRIGSPEEIARACLFLVSEEASFITGSILPVDGGGLAGG